MRDLSVCMHVPATIAINNVDTHFTHDSYKTEDCNSRIVVQNPDPRFVQQNPWMVRIQILHIHMYMYHIIWNVLLLSINSASIWGYDVKRDPLYMCMYIYVYMYMHV